MSEPDNSESVLSLLDIARSCYETYMRSGGESPKDWNDLDDAEVERWYYVALVPLDLVDALERTEEV